MAKTTLINNREVPFDDSASIVQHVDTITENMTANGMIYFGLGTIITKDREEDIEVRGVIHLRMTPLFAMKMGEYLLSAGKQGIDDARHLLLGAPLKKN